MGKRETAQRDAKERRALAEIGRIISSSLDIDEVYERFAEQVRTLISADRIVVGLIDLSMQSLSHPYIWGTDVPQRQRDDVVLLDGTQAGEVVKAETGLLFHSQDRHEVEQSMPGLLPLFDSGIRSFLSAPLISKDQTIGVLHLRSLIPNAYTQRDLELAESVGSQIAGAIAGSRLHSQVQREASEREVLAEIGRIIGSSLDLEEVYERFTEEVRKLIRFDRISINTVDLEKRMAGVAYNVGLKGPGSPVADQFPLEGTTIEHVIRARKGLIFQGEELQYLLKQLQYPSLAVGVGIKSVITVPLFSRDTAIGAITFRSLESDAYSHADLRMGEHIGAQIAGAIANSQLYTDLQREAEERSVLGEIGRIINSSLEIYEVYEQFARQTRKLIEFDISSISLLKSSDEFIVAYTSELIVPSRQLGEIITLEGSGTGITLERNEVTVINMDDEKTLRSKIPGLVPPYLAGIRTFMGVPLSHKGEAIGALLFTSTNRSAFNERDARLAERVAAQISGAIANSQLHLSLQRVSDQRKLVADVGRIIGSSLDIDRVYEQFARRVRASIIFDRISIVIIDRNQNTATTAFEFGAEIPRWERGIVHPLEGTAAGKIISSGSGILLNEKQLEDATNAFKPLSPGLHEAGLRSRMSVPLVSDNKPIGVLTLNSYDANAYTDSDLALAEQIATHIASAIANAELHKMSQRDSMERQTLAEVGRVISSSLDVSDVYVRFAELVNELLPSERIVVSSIDSAKRTVTNAHVWGMAIPDREVDDGHSIEGSVTDLVVKSRTGIIVNTDNLNQILYDHPTYNKTSIAVGLVSMIAVPLISDDEIIGILTLKSKSPEAYVQRDLRLAERIAAQISGSVANSLLYENLQNVEAKLLQSQKMEAIGQLAGGVAHDFNNILTAILSYCELGRYKVSPGDVVGKYFEQIEVSAQRAATLTRQLLAFSRRQIIQPRTVDMNELIRGMETMIRRLIAENIELNVALTSKAAPVIVDPGQMEQVLMNLTVNARDAMPDGGKLIIETSEVFLDGDYVERHPEASLGDHLVISVADTGCGMAEGVISHIFEPFYSTKEVGKGTGLGLSTCYGIVKQSDGHITVESQPLKGSRFQIFLPRTEEPIKYMPLQTASGYFPVGNENVLLVEDEPSVRSAAASVLREQGYNVLEAVDGVEALRVAESTEIDEIELLITDVVMPRMGGRELANRLRQRNSKVKILYMSGYTDDSVVHQEILGAGAGFLQKPFTLSELLHRIREVLGKGSDDQN